MDLTGGPGSPRRISIKTMNVDERLTCLALPFNSCQFLLSILAALEYHSQLDLFEISCNEVISRWMMKTNQRDLNQTVSFSLLLMNDY